MGVGVPDGGGGAGRFCTLGSQTGRNFKVLMGWKPRQHGTTEVEKGRIERTGVLVVGTGGRVCTLDTDTTYQVMVPQTRARVWVRVAARGQPALTGRREERGL